MSFLLITQFGPDYPPIIKTPAALKGPGKNLRFDRASQEDRRCKREALYHTTEDFCAAEKK